MTAERATIVALASGAGKAGIAVVRASGPAVRCLVEAVAGSVPPPRRASRRRLRDRSGETIDDALVLVFDGPASFTGEDVAEFHVHGGRAIVSALIETLTDWPGVRLADPGEFTRRAVENGRLDLTSAEGIADLVEAETAGQRRQALHQAGGALERAAERWRGDLLRALALVEAEIDFPDEGDVPQLLGSVRTLVGRLLGEIEAALAGAARGERLRQGATIVIAGPPNAGKSTLLNALARREVAIVSPVAGTTRDMIEVHLDLDGYPAVLVDTAGLRETGDAVEAMGVERAWKRAEAADLVLWLMPADSVGTAPETFAAPVLRVATKIDSAPVGRLTNGDLAVSAVTGEGLPALLARMVEAARSALAGAEQALVTRARHRTELQTVAAHLRRVASSADDVPVEFVGEDLRLAVRSIGRLTGRVDIDEVYDLIFREFCIGK